MRKRAALARPSAAKSGKDQAVDRPHHQRRQAGRRYREPDPRFLQKGAGAEGISGNQRNHPGDYETGPCRDVGAWRFGEDAIVGGAAAHFRGQGPVATGDPEPDHERHRSDERGRRGIARIADQHRRGRAGRRTRCRERFGLRDCLTPIPRASSRLSIPPSPAAWGWGCRSAARSSRRMAAGYGQGRTSLAAPCFA